MSQIAQDIQRQQIAARTAALGAAIERATQQTANSFASIVADAATLRQDVAASDAHDEADVAYNVGNASSWPSRSGVRISSFS